MNKKVLGKLKKQYGIYLKNTYQLDGQGLLVHEEPVRYSTTYLIPTQKLNANAVIEVPLDVLGLYYRKDFKLIYKLNQIDHEKCELVADLIGLEVNSVYSNLGSKYPPNIEVLHKDKQLGFEFKLKALYKDRSFEGKLCSLAIRKKIKKDLMQYLHSDQCLAQYKNNYPLFIRDLLTKKLQKQILTHMVAWSQYLKNIVLVSSKKY